MSNNKILLVNPNLIHPPISPVGLDYISAALGQNNISTDLLDFCLPEPDLEKVLSTFDPGEADYLLIGISVRNVDDSYSVSRDFIFSH